MSTRASTVPNLAQDTGTQSAWDPSTISNIVFGTIMVFVGIIAIWQGCHRRLVVLDEELAIIRRPSEMITSLNYSCHIPGGTIQGPQPQPIHQSNSTACATTTYPAAMNGDNRQHRPSIVNNVSTIPAITTGLTAVSTMGSPVSCDETISHN